MQVASHVYKSHDSLCSHTNYMHTLGIKGKSVLAPSYACLNENTDADFLFFSVPLENLVFNIHLTKQK